MEETEDDEVEEAEDCEANEEDGVRIEVVLLDGVEVVRVVWNP